MPMKNLLGLVFFFQPSMAVLPLWFPPVQTKRQREALLGFLSQSELASVFHSDLVHDGYSSCSDMPRHSHSCPSAQGSEAKELSTRTPSPATTGEYFGADLGEPFA